MRRKIKSDYGLVDVATGEILGAGITLWKASKGGKFMKLWQGAGWAKRMEGMQGNSLKILMELVDMAGWRNEVPGPSEIAERLGKRQPHVSKAYHELIEAGFLHKTEGVYMLDPYFCWKGNDEQYEEACRRVGRGRVVKQIVDRA